MAKKPKGRFRSRWDSYSERAKGWVIISAVVSGITGAIVGMAAAYPIVEPYWYVSRGALRLVTDRQAIATDRSTLFQLQYYLDLAKRDPAANTSPEVRRRIDELNRQITDTENRIHSSSGRR